MQVVMSGSNIGHDTHHPDSVASEFSLVCLQMLGYYLELSHGRFLVDPFRFVIHYYRKITLESLSYPSVSTSLYHK